MGNQRRFRAFNPSMCPCLTACSFIRPRTGASGRIHECCVISRVEYPFHRITCPVPQDNMSRFPEDTVPFPRGIFPVLQRIISCFPENRIHRFPENTVPFPTGLCAVSKMIMSCFPEVYVSFPRDLCPVSNRIMFHFTEDYVLLPRG